MRKAIGDRLTGHVEVRLCLSLVGGVVDSCLHGWKADALHYKVLDTILDLWTRGLEWHLDNSLRIAFVEDVRIIKLDDGIVQSCMAVGTATAQLPPIAALFTLCGLLRDESGGHDQEVEQQP